MRPGRRIKGGVAALVASGVLVLASVRLMDFLGRWEGQGQQVVYADRLARGLPTMCKGVTKHTSPYPVVVGDYWSPERCAEVERMVVSKGQLQTSPSASRSSTHSAATRITSEYRPPAPAVPWA